MDTKSLGRIFQEWRIESDLSQVELGQELGVSRKIIGSIESGDRQLDEETIVRLCRFLGKDLEELVLLWSRFSLEALRKVERGIGVSKEIARPDEPRAEAPESAASPSIDALAAKFASLIKDAILLSQVELVQRLQLQIPSPAAPASPSPARARRPRSRVSRKGRTGRAHKVPALRPEVPKPRL
jgi:transcriptional regulator with XRE-family HTH domain